MRCEACETKKDVKKRRNGWTLCKQCEEMQREATGK